MTSLTRTLAISSILAGVLVGSVPRAHATDKAIIQLQVQVQQLEDTISRMQQASDERWALTKNALDQNADTLNKLSVTMAAIQQQLAAAQDSSRTDQLSAQVQAVHDSVDEVKARLGQLQKQLNDIAAAQQNIQSQPPPQTAPAGQGASAAPAPDNGGSAPDTAQPAAAAAYVPPVKDLYQSAYRDYTSAHYKLAQQEFEQIVQAYPQDDLAGNSQFYLGEIAFHQGEYREAAKAYDEVLKNYPGSTKSAAAQLRKGDALIQVGQRTEGIRELRGVIQRYPQSPESVQARSTLNGMGVTPNPKPSPIRNQ
jgi:tol-pal system protein YbgF